MLLAPRLVLRIAPRRLPVAALALIVAACGREDTSTERVDGAIGYASTTDAGWDASTADAAAGALCCLPSERLGSPMAMGGARVDGGCLVTRDLVCTTNWRMERDPSGCAVWRFDARSPAPNESAQCPSPCGSQGDLRNVACAANAWCDRGAGVCAGAPGTDEALGPRGVCRPRPSGTTTECTSRVCGCDGKTYCGEGAAHAAGVAVALEGACTFACGEETCDALGQYCLRTVFGPQPADGGSSFRWECKPFGGSAGACGANPRSCACALAQEKGVGACTVLDGHVRIEVGLP